MSEQNFATFDINLTVALITKGYELLEIDRTAHETKMQFIIRREEGLDKTIEEFWNGTLELNARRLFENMKMLKNRMYSIKNI